jgi:hypothetical protein
MKYLIHLVLHLHFAWRAYRLKREPDWVYYRQFFTPLNRQWQFLLHLNQKMAWVYGGLLVVGGLSGGLFLFIYLQNLDYQEFNLAIGLAGLAILSYLFLHLRQQGNQWYQQFHQEIEARIKANKSTQITDYQQLILKKYLFYSHLQIFKYLAIWVASIGIGLYVLEEIKRAKLTKPEHLSQQIKQKIKQDEASLGKLKTKVIQNQQNLQATQIRIKVKQNLLQIAQNSVQQQYYALFQSQGFRNTLQDIRLKINDLQQSGKTTSQIEEILRNDALIWSQIKGLAEVRLSLLEEDTNQAEAKLGQSGETLKSFQDLVYIYNRMHEKAQVGLNLDNQKIKKLKIDIDWQQCLQEKLRTALYQDSLLINQNQHSIAELKKQLQQRQAKLAKSLKNKGF